MDVGAPGNFERLRWIYADDAALRKALGADAVDDTVIREEIRTSESRYGTLVCPHTATATAVLARMRARGDHRDFAVVATAHPAKFEDVIEPLIGRTIDVPPALAELLARPSRREPIAANYTALRERLIALAG
jgi:threonine synthase